MPRPIPCLETCKADARRLHKALLSDDAETAATAAERFLRLRKWSDMGRAEFLTARESIKRKHALEVVAREHGYVSWKKLKDATDVVWYPHTDGFLNNWFAAYEDARACRELTNGYLLTHKGQYFVCGAEFIRNLGLDPKDPRWAAIGFDCARPNDERAFQELYEAAKKRAASPA